MANQKFIGTEVNNWIVVKSPKAGYYTVKCKSCGKERIICCNSVRKKYLRPCQCDENIVKEYNNNKNKHLKHIGGSVNGYTIIDRVPARKTSSNYILKCDKCGSIREISAQTLSNGTIRPCNCQYKCYARTERQKEIVGLFQKGYNLSDIARFLKISRSSVSCSFNWTLKNYNTFKYNKQKGE